MPRDTSPRPSTSAERMRAMRKRRGQGLMVVPLHVREAEIDGLIRRGLLAPEARADRHAIAVALGKLLDRWRLAQALARSLRVSLADCPHLAEPGDPE